ncbi:MAG: peptidylprolyl isomerase [Gammaproteobacteria bacterium]|nr:peptidylprolyl isomerase [Gammaproteobacteria bacterium]
MASANARHILVADRNRCEEIKQRIEDGEDFADLARNHSTCPSARRGGDLGEFGPGQMVPEFDRVVFSAPVGEVQGPVKTQFGYHLLEVTRRED